MKYKMQKDRFNIYIGLLSIEIYWPRLVKSNVDIGIFLPSFILYKTSNEWNRWELKRSLAFKILGFGLGVAWDHCYNPNKAKEGEGGRRTDPKMVK